MSYSPKIHILDTLHLNRKGLRKFSCSWRYNEINTSFKLVFVQYPIIIPFEEKVITCINSTVRMSLQVSIIAINWKLTSGQRKLIPCVLYYSYEKLYFLNTGRKPCLSYSLAFRNDVNTI